MCRRDWFCQFIAVNKTRGENTRCKVIYNGNVSCMSELPQSLWWTAGFWMFSSQFFWECKRIYLGMKLLGIIFYNNVHSVYTKPVLFSLLVNLILLFRLQISLLELHCMVSLCEALRQNASHQTLTQTKPEKPEHVYVLDELHWTTVCIFNILTETTSLRCFSPQWGQKLGIRVTVESQNPHAQHLNWIWIRCGSTALAAGKTGSPGCWGLHDEPHEHPSVEPHNSHLVLFIFSLSPLFGEGIRKATSACAD